MSEKSATQIAPKGLPPSEQKGKTILVSTMQEPRVTIRNSKWATRGWTYQEGILAKRRLVFTYEQIYWECNGMVLNESISLPVLALHVPPLADSHRHFEDYMLSGVFSGDMHRLPEFQYGFSPKEDDHTGEQVKTLDGHNRAFTSRTLTDPNDSWVAFLGVAARYFKPSGLAVLLGLPVWTGDFADGQPGLQRSFAMSLSVWFHIGHRTEPNSELYIANCRRRPRLPSWSWIGWEGQVDFNGDNNDYAAVSQHGDIDEDNPEGDNAHIDFFTAMDSPEWVQSIDHIWSAEMTIHTEDGRYSTLMYGRVPMDDFLDVGKERSRSWLLTIKEPLVLRHLYLMQSTNSWEWRRLMGKLIEMHLSVPLTENELMEGHRSGEMVSVLVFASVVPFVWEGRARIMVLRKRDPGGDVWERVGGLLLIMEEWMMGRYQSSEEIVKDLPVKKFGRAIVIA